MSGVFFVFGVVIALTALMSGHALAKQQNGWAAALFAAAVIGALALQYLEATA